MIIKENIFVTQFEKNLIKTDWQSTNYLVKFGNFEAYLTTLRLDLDYKQLYGNKIGNGQYGVLYKYCLDNK